MSFSGRIIKSIEVGGRQGSKMDLELSGPQKVKSDVVRTLILFRSFISI